MDPNANENGLLPLYSNAGNDKNIILFQEDRAPNHTSKFS